MTEDNELALEKMKRRSTIILLYLGVLANLSNISGGFCLGYSAVSLPGMRNSNSTFSITEDEASWVASLASIAMPVGALLVGPLVDKFGRKLGIISMNIPSFIGWLCIALANGDYTLQLIYAGRILTGVAVGMVTAPAGIFVSEISTESLRGMLVTWTAVAMSTGLLLVYILGTIFPDDWRLVAGISAVFPFVTTIVSFILLPESPIWLLTKGRRKAAESNYRKIRGLAQEGEMPTYFETEFNRMEGKLGQSNDKPKESWTQIIKYFCKPSAIKPLLIMNLFFFFQQFSGVYVLIFYAVDVVQAFGIDFNPYYVAVIIGVTRFAITFVYGYVSQRFGRRPPVMISGTATTCLMFLLTLYLYLSFTGAIERGYLGWLAVVCLVIHICSSSIGFLTLPWAMVGEVFPNKIRGIACGITTCFGNLLGFAVIKVFPDMLNSMYMHGTFFFYAVVTLCGTIFVSLFLPETQGKSLLEIEEEFDAKNNECKNHSGVYYITERFISQPFFHPDHCHITDRNVKISQPKLSINENYSYNQLEK